MNLNRRTLIAVGGAAAAVAATPALAKSKKRPFVINALGGFYNPNSNGAHDEEDIAAHRLDPRPIADTRAAGVAATNATIGYVFGDGDPFPDTIDEIAWWSEAIRLRPDALSLIRTADDIRAAHEAGKAGIIIGFQNTEMFGKDVSRVRLFSDLGVRIVQMTYNLRNAAGDGALVAENKGLTDFGRELVAALNKQRLLVDLSHSGEKTAMDALAASTVPIAITHTGCAALAPHPRNKTDAELKALADKGGVAGIYFMPYLTPGRQQMAADIVAHIEHAVNVMGEDHVGIGTDGGATAIDDMPVFMEAFRKSNEDRRKAGIAAPNEDDNIITTPPDLMGPEQFEKLAGLLSARGYKQARIEKIMSGNFLRLFGEVWGG
ncbi:MAG: peptidase M19 [Alphaproteobacteria bacterium RIFCSPHIGHO2_12_FULL_63_12]|nr:MAG: peptidase M19 [Alphaproteobacteria bacterium RIFCSPHIGHO2_12_FULL_63_12]